MESTIDNVWLHVKKTIDEKVQEAGQTGMDATADAAIKRQILQVAKPDSPVRGLLCKYFQ